MERDKWHFGLWHKERQSEKVNRRTLRERQVQKGESDSHWILCHCPLYININREICRTGRNLCINSSAHKGVRSGFKCPLECMQRILPRRTFSGALLTSAHYSAHSTTKLSLFLFKYLNLKSIFSIFRKGDLNFQSIFVQK